MTMTTGLLEALKYREQGDHETARMKLLALLQNNLDDPVLNYQTALAHDNLGLESEAIPLYERAIANGLSGKDLENAIIGLGSSLRCTDQHESSLSVLQDGVDKFPDNWSMKVFLAMTLHELDQTGRAMEMLLTCITQTSSNPSIKEYELAISFYARCYGEKA
jgi:tetratricopeptide (TPR) repeat protein